MLEVTSLGSGSSGNSLLIRTAESTLLVDCGVGIRRLKAALDARRLGIADIDVLLLSHEHGDHVRELPRFVSTGAAIVATRGTSRATQLPESAWTASRPHRPIAFRDIEIVPVPVSHDATEPCGFLVRTQLGSITVLTDLGRPSGAEAEAIAESRLVVIEANHDEHLLRRGPYPQHLKRRILSDTGHLSNESCAELLLSALQHAGTFPTVWLAHLSQTNNRPQLARRSVALRLARRGLALDIEALPRLAASSPWSPGTTSHGIAQLAFEF